MTNGSTEQTANRLVWRRLAITMAAAVVVILGARGAFLLSQHMMNAVALVGSWMMLALIACYPAVRFRPSVGVPLLAGFGVGAIVVVLYAGADMMMG
jgi:hypothetical protein